MSFPSFRLDEKRLWQLIGGVLGVSLILVFASMQFPWWTASLYPDDAQEVRGEFELGGSSLSYYRDDEPAACPRAGYCDRETPYEDGSGMGTVMERTTVFISLGLVALVAYLAGLLGFYYGKINSQRMVVSVGFAALGFLVLGIAYFTLTVAAGGVEEVDRLFSKFGAALGQGGIQRPEAKFWGAQEVSGMDLLTAPAVGWLLAILGAVNLAFGTVLLYQFPEAAEDDGSSYAVEDEKQEPPATLQASG